MGLTGGLAASSHPSRHSSGWLSGECSVVVECCIAIKRVDNSIVSIHLIHVPQKHSLRNAGITRLKKKNPDVVLCPSREELGAMRNEHCVLQCEWFALGSR
jgi:hypothetical protein